MNVIVIGGGAAGFFAAINAAEMSPDMEVHVFEKAAQFLSKVRVSGGVLLIVGAGMIRRCMKIGQCMWIDCGRS